MSKRKQVSAEEKRIRMLELFHEKKDFYQLKVNIHVMNSDKEFLMILRRTMLIKLYVFNYQELEKIAPKEKQIVAQSVKDVIQNLVDDGLIDTDKVGTSVYYWSFPRYVISLKTLYLLK